MGAEPLPTGHGLVTDPGLGAADAAAIPVHETDAAEE
jgi:hypothetical protein